MLKPEGTILVHRPEEHFMPEVIGPLVRTDQREYGRSIVDFYKFAASPATETTNTSPQTQNS